MEMTDVEAINWSMGVFGAAYALIQSLWAVLIPEIKKSGFGRGSFAVITGALIVGLISFGYVRGPTPTETEDVPFNIAELLVLLSLFIVVIGIPVTLFRLSEPVPK